MAFWENLSPGVRRYIVLALVLLGLLLAFRKCTGPDLSAPPPPRGLR
jgi:hypothetical protein